MRLVTGKWAKTPHHLQSTLSAPTSGCNGSGKSLLLNPAFFHFPSPTQIYQPHYQPRGREWAGVWNRDCIPSHPLLALSIFRKSAIPQPTYLFGGVSCLVV